MMVEWMRSEMVEMRTFFIWDPRKEIGLNGRV